MNNMVASGLGFDEEVSESVEQIKEKLDEVSNNVEAEDEMDPEVGEEGHQGGGESETAERSLQARGGIKAGRL